MQGVQSFEALVGLTCGLIPLLAGLGVAALWAEHPTTPEQLARSPFVWALLLGPVSGTFIGTWAYAQRAVLERRLHAQRAALRDELDAIQRQNRLSAEVIGAGHSAILVFGDDGAVLQTNPAAERIFGYPEGAFARVGIDLLLPDLRALRDDEALTLRTAAGEPIGRQWRTRGRHADGTFFLVELEQATLPELSLRMVTVREATTAVKEEQRRVRDAVQAEHERAVDLSRHRGALLDRLSQELRNHLNLVLTGSEHLASELRATPDGLSDDAMRMRRSAHTMLTVVDKLLNLSMADDTLQDLSVEPVAVPGLIDELVHSLRPLILRNGNSLQLRLSEELPILSTDRQKLAHALRNLLNNAARYTRDGTITVEAVLEPGQGTDWIGFYVSDTGRGLTAGEMDRVFKAFSLPEPSTHQEVLAIGTGLALSQHCARLLGGHIAVRSAPGEGSTFSLRLPVRRPEARASRDTQDRPANTQ